MRNAILRQRKSLQKNRSAMSRPRAIAAPHPLVAGDRLRAAARAGVVHGGCRGLCEMAGQLRRAMPQVPARNPCRPPPKAPSRCCPTDPTPCRKIFEAARVQADRHVPERLHAADPRRRDPGAKQKQISAVATVPGAASISASANHAVVLLFVNQTIMSARTRRPTPHPAFGSPSTRSTGVG